jgi:NAD(P)-dependent dehydrogenase (short-subunit alcohol dehydrogenase family)
MNVVITGASRGIGYELVKLFLAEGHRVLAISRNEEKLKTLKIEGATTLAFDLCKDSYQPIINTVSSFGHIDIVINNAGALVNKPFEELTNDDIKYVYNVNVFSIIKLTRDLMPSFSDDAHVINISSVGGVQGSVKFPGLSVYSSSKGALSILTECLAEEFKETSYHFNTLALGAVQTEMLEEAFPGYKADVSPIQMASFILKFAVEDGKLFNGKTVTVSSSTP